MREINLILKTLIILAWTESLNKIFVILFEKIRNFQIISQSFLSDVLYFLNCQCFAKGSASLFSSWRICPTIQNSENYKFCTTLVFAWLSIVATRARIIRHFQWGKPLAIYHLTAWCTSGHELISLPVKEILSNFKEFLPKSWPRREKPSSARIQFVPKFYCKRLASDNCFLRPTCFEVHATVTSNCGGRYSMRWRCYSLRWVPGSRGRWGPPWSSQQPDVG